MTAETTQPPPTEERIDIPTWSTVTLAVSEGAATADGMAYGAFLVHIGGFGTSGYPDGPATEHRFWFNVTHVASGYAAAVERENREAHFIAREFAACPAFVALCDARGAGGDMKMTAEVAEWYQRTLRDAAIAYGAYAGGGAK